MTVEVAQGKGVELVFHGRPHPVDGPLDDVVEQVALQEREQGGSHIEGDHDEQDGGDGAEVDPLPRDEVDAGEEVGDAVLALGPGGRHRLLAGDSGRQLPADGAGEDQVGGAAQDLGADGRQRHAHDSGQDDEGHPDPLGGQPPQEPPGRGAEVHRPLADQAPHTVAGAHLPLDPLGFLHPPGRAHDASTLSWESTIST